MADKPQSKFWVASDSSESDSDTEYSSSEEEIPQKEVEAPRTWHIESDVSSVDEQRVVKSAADKAEEAFKKAHKEIKNSLNIKDWNTVLQLYNKLSALLSKHSDVGKASSASIENYPEYYFFALKLVQDEIKTLSSNKAAQKKLSKTNNKSFNALRARLKKLVDEDLQIRIDNSETKIKAYEADEKDLDSSDSESESDSSSSYDSYDSDSEESAEDAKNEDLNSDSESDWGSDTADSSSSSDDDGPKLSGRAFWLKKLPSHKTRETNEQKKIKEQDKQERAKQRKLVKEAEAQKKLGEEVVEEEFTMEIARTKVEELLSTRGKKLTDRMALVNQMQVCVDRSTTFGFKFQLPFMMHLVVLMFDVSGNLDSAMPVKLWLRCYHLVKKIVFLVQSNDIILDHLSGDEEADKAAELANDKLLRVIGDLSTFTDRLNIEYEKSLRNMEKYSSEYAFRLQHEGLIVDLAKKVHQYYLRVGDNLKASVLCSIVIKSMYYKHETLAKPVFKVHLATKKFGPRELWHPASVGYEKSRLHPGAFNGNFLENVDKETEYQEFNVANEVNKSFEFVRVNGTKEMKTKVVLWKIYHLSLHDKYFEARDLLLASRLQESISNFEVEIQSLYNRALVQLGFCAFRQGFFKRAHSCLMDLCQHRNRIKELLSQGVYWRKHFGGVDLAALKEFQRQETRRVLPYHLHIDQSLLFFVYLSSAMLLEIPNMASQERGSRGSGGKVISRVFRRYLDMRKNHQPFHGPPDNSRESVLIAAVALENGDWKACADAIMQLSEWQLFNSRVPETKTLLLKEIKVQALRTYLIKYSSVYESIFGSHLVELFALPIADIKSVVSKLILSEKIKGSWDKSDNDDWMLILRSNDLTHLQALACRYASQLEKIVDSNEALLNKIPAEEGQRDDTKAYNRTSKVMFKT